MDELVRWGVTTVCLSPGSRSTPLVAAAAAHPGLHIVTHVDERGAAFFCVGHGRASGVPAVWITTSGTAVANGLPAVIEAAMDHVPMICLTADRPEELRGTGANQTIRQPGIFADYPRYQADLEVPTPDSDPLHAREAAHTAVLAAIGLPSGPVHLNCPFRKPLEPTGPWPNATGVNDLPTPHSFTPDVAELATKIDDLQFGVILAGRMDERTALAVDVLAAKLSWPVLPDICSQRRLGPGGPLAVRHSDLLSGQTLPQPQGVIQIGRMPVSQRLTQTLAAGKPKLWAVLADGDERIHPHHVVPLRLRDACSATTALAAAITNKQADPRLATWLEADRRVARGLAGEWGKGEYGRKPTILSEPAIAAQVARHLTERDALVVAASMPVRDVNSFAGSGGRPAFVVSNRGASGIDGTIATAAGVADVLSRRENLGRTVLLIGDLAFLHDLNSLGLIRGRRVTLIVVNNDGGGIFSFLPIATNEELFEPYFGMAHGLHFDAAAALYGIPYQRPPSLTAFAELLEASQESPSPLIIELNTSRRDNVDEHRRLEHLVAQWLG